MCKRILFIFGLVVPACLGISPRVQEVKRLCTINFSRYDELLRLMQHRDYTTALNEEAKQYNYELLGVILSNLRYLDGTISSPVSGQNFGSIFRQYDCGFVGSEGHTWAEQPANDHIRKIVDLYVEMKRDYSGIVGLYEAELRDNPYVRRVCSQCGK